MYDPTTFLLFNDLPTDIRCLIWSYTMPGPRIHRISRPEAHLPAIGSCHPPLNLLLACHESHDEVLHNLRKLPLPSHEGPCPPSHSTSASKPTSVRQPCCPYILFNPLIDTLYLPGSAIHLKYHIWFSRPIDFSIIRRLAVDVAWSCQHPTGYDEGISIPAIVALLGHVKDLYIVSERSYFRPVADDSVYQEAISHWGKIVPIEGRRWDGKGKGLGNLYQASAGDGGCWGWVEPVDRMFWEELTQASWKEARLAVELEDERDLQTREGGDSTIRWNVPRVQMRFIRLDKDANMKKEGLASMDAPDENDSSDNLGPVPSKQTEMPAIDEGPTNHEVADQRWAWSHGPRNAGLRFSMPLLERLGFRKGGKGKFKMPYEL